VARENIKRSAKFVDLESDDKKDMTMSIAPFEDQSFQTTMMELETAVQVGFIQFVRNILLISLNEYYSCK
jgi:hypothetical protein